MSRRKRIEQLKGPLYAIVQAGYVAPERYTSRAAAEAEAERLNAEADEELGEELFGDGAASVIEVEP